MESYKLVEAYLEEFHKNPVATSLWTIAFILAIAAITLYSKWREWRNKQRRKF